MCFQVKQRLQTAGLQTAGLYIANTRPGGLTLVLIHYKLCNANTE